MHKLHKVNFEGTCSRSPCHWIHSRPHQLRRLDRKQLRQPGIQFVSAHIDTGWVFNRSLHPCTWTTRSIVNLNLVMKIMTYSITFLDHKPLHMQVLCTAGTRYWVLVKGFLVPPDTNCTGSSRIPSRQVPQQGNPLMHSKTLALLIIQGERMRCKDKMKWMIYTLYKSETEGACW